MNFRRGVRWPSGSNRAGSCRLPMSPDSPLCWSPWGGIRPPSRAVSEGGAMDHFHLKDGQLCSEQVELRAIAEEIGTPVYVYSSATLRHHAAVIKQALAALDDPLIAYAVKANPNGAVLATLAAEGLGADIVSIGEYRRARAAGLAAAGIV